MNSMSPDRWTRVGDDPLRAAAKAVLALLRFRTVIPGPDRSVAIARKRLDDAVHALADPRPE
jgi:hypothetical protein